MHIDIQSLTLMSSRLENINLHSRSLNNLGSSDSLITTVSNIRVTSAA